MVLWYLGVTAKLMKAYSMAIQPNTLATNNKELILRPKNKQKTIAILR